jgi:hypothetical protein
MTVRIGTLMPTPSVSVPQMTRAAALRERLDEAPISRQHARVVHADPARTSRDSVLPNPVVKRNAPIASAISSRCAREVR